MNKNLTIKIQHTGIHVRNLEESVQWYSDVLGFTLIDKGNEKMLPGVFPTTWKMKKDDFYLELYETPAAEPFSFVDYEHTLGVKHLSFSVAEFDELMTYIKERGDIKILTENYYSEKMCGIEGGDRVAYILDCNGILLELQKIHDWG